MRIDIRKSERSDRPTIEAICANAFPDEDLIPLIRSLLDEPTGVVTLVAEREGEIRGHCTFTTCGIAGGTGAVTLLGPLAVAPDAQRTGIGSSLVRNGLAMAKRDGASGAVVLGDPAYYGRFGFEPEQDVAPPYALPSAWRDAWRSVRFLGSGPFEGVLDVPAPWRRPELWGA